MTNMEPINFDHLNNSNHVFSNRGEGRRLGSAIKPTSIKPSRPNPKKIAAIAPLIRGVTPRRLSAIEQIAEMAGERPALWQKPAFGDFEYWLAHRCGWITDEELANDTHSHQQKRDVALKTSHRFSMQRFSWAEEPRYPEPRETNEYIPQVNMKIINDRNLTDSSRRIALFVMRHAYQDNRAGRFIGMTVSFIMKGLSLSRRTVQRSLTLLECRGYLRCEVAHNSETRMCVGLIIHLMQALFPKHHKETWPEKRRNPDASSVPHKQTSFNISIQTSTQRTIRFSWATRCMNGVLRNAQSRFCKLAISACEHPKKNAIGSTKHSIHYQNELHVDLGVW